MHVAIVGAGASGLNAARHLLNNNEKKFTCEVFDRNEEIGGTWYYTDDVGVDKYGFPVFSGMYTGLRTNLPKEVMCYADYKWPEQYKCYVTQPEVLAFLHKFADDFNLKPHIRLLTMVKEIRPLSKNRWLITTIHIPTRIETTKEFDAVIVCSGHFNVGLYPEIPGRESFKGKEIHSHDYRKPEPFKDQKILVIGAGPSGLDMAVTLSEHAESLILSRRKNANNLQVNCEFPEKVILKPDVIRLTENGVEFADGTRANIDTIIYCTGYKYSFPFLHEDCKIVIEEDVYMRPLYKHIINVEYPTMSFIGMTYRGCSFPMYDLQIRYYVQYLLGNMILPTKPEMYNDIAEDVLKRKRKGFTKKQYHFLNEDFVWDYYKSLADEANIENIWKSIVQLRLNCAKNVGENILTFRNDRYKIINQDTFVKLND